MKILLTGGTGLLGTGIGKEFAKRGHRLLVVTRDSSRLMPYPCALISWESMRSNPEKLSDVTALVHLAGENIAAKRWSRGRKQALLDSRVLTGEAAIESLRLAKAKITTVITASATGIYGDRGDEILTEDSHTGADFTAKLCQAWEEATKNAFPNARWVALRTAPVLSRKGGYLAKVVPIFRRVGASQLSSGRQFFSFIHASDYHRLALWALEDERVQGPLNAAAEQPLRNSEWTKLLAESLRVMRNLPVPKLVLKVRFGELADLMTASQRVIPEKALKLGFRFHFPDAVSAVGDLLR